MFYFCLNNKYLYFLYKKSKNTAVNMKFNNNRFLRKCYPEKDRIIRYSKHNIDICNEIIQLIIRIIP